MNFEERRIVKYRVGASILLFLSLFMFIFSIVMIAILHAEEMILSIISLALAICFLMLELVLMIKGGRKPLHLHKIAFNDNDTLNNVPLVAVIVGAVLGTGFVILPIVVLFVRDEVSIKSSMFVVLSIGFYLMINTIIYFMYIVQLRKRPVTLADLSK